MSFENILPIICFFAPIVLGILLWYERFQRQNIKENIERRDRQERRIEEQQRKFKYEKAIEAYEAIKKAGCEDILNTLAGYDGDEIINTLCEISNYIGALGISSEDASIALRDLATSLEDYAETPKQKEPQIIFEPKVMIMETSDKKFIYPVENESFKIIQDNVKVDYDNNNNEFIITKNMADDWYEKFMEEVKLG